MAAITNLHTGAQLTLEGCLDEMRFNERSVGQRQEMSPELARAEELIEELVAENADKDVEIEALRKLLTAERSCRQQAEAKLPG